MNEKPLIPQLILPTVESPSTFLGIPTLAILWAYIGVAALSITGIYALDPEKSQFGPPASDASNAIRVACGVILWAGFSIRFACAGIVHENLPRKWLLIVLVPLLVLLGLVGWIALLFIGRISISRLPRGKLRTGLFVAFAAPCALMTLLGMEMNAVLSLVLFSLLFQ